MARKYYDRYGDFKKNGEYEFIPFIKLTQKSSDIKIVYKRDSSRLDIISNKYYGAPYYGWLILTANPQYGGLEFSIPDGATIRVPFPLSDALQDYQNKVEKYKQLYGNE
jgi:hypothetical protein